MLVKFGKTSNILTIQAKNMGGSMNILFASAHLGKGGGQQTQSIRLINEIGKHCNASLITLSYPSDIVDSVPNTIYAGKLRFPKGIVDLHRYIKKHRKDFDILQVLDYYYSLPAAWRSGFTPYVVRFGMDPLLDLEWRKKKFSKIIARMMLPSMLKKSSQVIVNSRVLERRFKKYNPLHIPNGYDIHSFTLGTSQSALRKRLELPTDKRLLLYTGKVIPRKNLGILFEILTELDDVMIIIIGNTNEPGYGDKYYRSLITKYAHLMDKIVFTREKTMSEIKYYLNACDIFVFPSLLEGSPNSVLEAMAAGLPVVCSDIPSHKEIIDHGKNGMLFHEKKQLVDCISKLLEEGKTARSIGEAGRRYVTKHHNIEKVAEKYITLYHEIAEGTVKPNPLKQVKT